MTVQEEIEGMLFTFPAGWQVSKYDKTAFHIRHFQSFAGGSKAVDAVAVSPDRTVWLIEIKDYRRTRRSKEGSVFAEIAHKVRSTLAGLATARVRANNADELSFAKVAMRGNRLRVALHLDQPRNPSRLFPFVVDPRTAIQYLRREMKAVDPHAVCYGCGVGDNHNPWTVEPIEAEE